MTSDHDPYGDTTAPVSAAAAGDIDAGTDTVQRALRTALRERFSRAHPELTSRHDLSTTEGLASVGAASAEADTTLVAVVVRDLDLAAWAGQTCAFALGLDAAQGAAWRRAFTRTVFLAGNPAELRARFPFARMTRDASVAWTAPGPPAATAALRRLLKLLHAPAEVPNGGDIAFDVPHPKLQVLHPVLRVPGPASGGAPAPSCPPVGGVVHLATADCTMSAALVHLNHLLTEAVLDGLVAPGDRFVLRGVPRLTAGPEPFDAVRVVPDERLPDRLRLAAALTATTRRTPARSRTGRF
ncbi:DUF6182 family protein [Streptomyces griseiscabiei]|uniref:DUF6182 family protein n=1 Tax=Streptomyces griseiscabiei TaxID=2993540 RepID=A0ABU4L6J6_9ACTN|nr:DUF6182 family protein [Streptomyces griseiscabiei]MBZ3906424.1 hypothetical protein [Streptomyces griseiscabiei]MDX2911419.1 DUF6182 family protein [Streptomyces griseiscabiei]